MGWDWSLLLPGASLLTEMALLPGWHNLVQQRLQPTAALPVAHGGAGPENAMGRYVGLLSPGGLSR